MSRLDTFLAELKRRRVYRAAVLYAVVGLGVLEGTDVLVPALRLPPWLVSAVAVAALIGFPLVLVLAWLYQVTPDGVERTTAAPPAEPQGRVVPVLVAGVTIAFIAFAGGWAVRSTTSQTAGLDGARTGERVPIAVLPFANLSGPDDVYFTDGLHEEVIARLANLPVFRVTSRTSVMGYRENTEPIGVVAQELGVQAVLEGSVRRAGSTLRVTAQLIDARQDEHLWAATYDREYSLEALLTIQTDVANEVAAALRVTLGPDATVVPSPPSDLEAYDLYLLARHHWNSRSPDDLNRSIALFEDAIALDSTFARAWAGLGDAYAVLPAYDDRATTAEAAPRAQAAAERALELDPGLADAHATMGFLAFTFEWDAEAADAHFARAVTLNPSHPPALYWQAWYLGLVGRVEEARAAGQRAALVGPRSFPVRFNVGDGLLQIGDFEAAKTHLTVATELEPSFALGWLDLGTAEHALGDPEAAQAAWREAGRLMGRPGLAEALGSAQRDANAARTLLREVMPLDSLNGPEAMTAIQAYGIVGDTASVVTLGARIHASRLPGIARIYGLPFVAPVIRDPALAPFSVAYLEAFSLEGR